MSENQKIKEEHTTSKDLINYLIRLSREGNYVFRGTSNDIQLNPTINRVRFHNEIRDLSNLEYQLLFEFYRNSSSFLNGSLDLIDFVAYAQHFGLPTRLIDWTRDPFIALFFAINQTYANNGNIRIYYTNLDNHTLLNRASFGLTYQQLSDGTEFIEDYRYFINSLNNQSLENRIIERNERLREINVKDNTHFVKNSLIFYDCKMSNERLKAQQGLFSIPKSIQEGDAKNEIISNSKSMLINLSNNERKKTMSFLANMNYTSLRLFPDLQNICEYIVKKQFVEE